MMRFVLKTALVTSLAAGVAAATFGPEKVMDWAVESTEKVTAHFHDIQGLEPELQRIEEKVVSLDEEILSLKEIAFKEELAIEELRSDIADRQVTVETLRANLERADSLLASQLVSIKIRGISYSRDEIEKDVAEKMRLYKVQRDTLRQLRETLQTRESSLALTVENAQRGESLREELKGQLRLLRAQLERYRAREVYAEAVANDFDAQEFNTGIGEARQMLAKFEQKLEVKSRMLDDRMRVSSGNDNVAGIDYSAPQEVTPALREELSLLLNEQDQPRAEEAVALQK